MKELQSRPKRKIGKIKRNQKLEKLLREYKIVRGRQYRLDTIFRELVAKKTGITITELSCLGYLVEKGQASPSDLAKITGLTSGAITGLVARLEKKGCLTLDKDKKDGRKVIVRPVHQKVAPGMLYYKPLTEKYYALLSRFDEDQISFLLYKSKRITEMLEEEIEKLIEV